MPVMTGLPAVARLGDADTPLGATLDGGSAFPNRWGVGGAPVTSADMSSITSVTDAPSSGEFLVVDDIFISVGADMNVTFKEETSGTVILGPFYLVTGASLQLTSRARRKLFTADKKLQAIASVAGNISVLVGYHSEA